MEIILDVPYHFVDQIKTKLEDFQLPVIFSQHKADIVVQHLTGNDYVIYNSQNYFIRPEEEIVAEVVWLVLENSYLICMRKIARSFNKKMYLEDTEDQILADHKSQIRELNKLLKQNCELHTIQEYENKKRTKKRNNILMVVAIFLCYLIFLKTLMIQ
jgi:hypothetical protein